MQQDRVEHRAEHVVLALVERAVADAHGAGARISGELGDRRFGEVSPAVDPVHDLQPAVTVGLDVGDELHELVGFPVEIQVVQRLQGEGRVADPGVAVVPVALAARSLRERGRERGHRRAGRHVREALHRQGRPLDGIAPAVIGDACLAEPVAPEARRGGEPGGGVVDIGGACELLGPGERAERLVARLERVPRPHAVALDAEREVGVQPDRLSGPGGVGDVAVAVDQRPLARRAAVVEHRLADQLDLDAAVEAFDRAHEHVVGVVVGRRPRVRRDLVLARGGPIVRASRTSTQPVGVRHDVTSALVPGS